MRGNRGSVIGTVLAILLFGVAVYSATRGLLLGVLLAGFAALLFVAAVIDNRYYARRRSAETEEEPSVDPPGH